MSNPPVTPTPEPPHTPTPWVLRGPSRPDNTGGCDWALLDDAGKIVAEFFQHVGYGTHGGYEIRPAAGNARYVLRAVNSYDALREALKTMVDAFDYARSGREYPDVEAIRAARRLAEEAHQ